MGAYSTHPTSGRCIESCTPSENRNKLDLLSYSQVSAFSCPPLCVGGVARRHKASVPLVPAGGGQTWRGCVLFFAECRVWSLCTSLTFPLGLGVVHLS